MKTYPRIFFAMALWLTVAAAAAEAGWSVGIGVGWPGWYGPYYGCRPHYWYPGPVFVVAPPPPVYVAPATVVQPAVVQPPYSAPPPAPIPAPAPTPAPEPSPTTPLPAPRRAPEAQLTSFNGYLRSLRDADEHVRLEAVTQLGRMKSQRAIDPLAATLAGDSSAAVREAAAKALGLIGSPAALPALNRAAQADVDRDVRHTARFAAEIIQAK
jgi:hypothetical protein